MKIENEKRRLINQREQLFLSINLNKELDSVEKSKMREFIDRSTKVDIEYLYDNAENYFDMNSS